MPRPGAPMVIDELFDLIEQAPETAGLVSEVYELVRKYRPNIDESMNDPVIVAKWRDIFRIIHETYPNKVLPP